MRRAFRGSVYHCLDAGRGEHFPDGVIVVDGGRIAAAGPADALLRSLPDSVPVEDHAGRLILPGFIDCHVHYAQLDIIAAYGEQLLDWLNRYAYPAEQQFADPAHAAAVAEAFLDQLLACGTTTALVFATVHPQSVDAIFEAAARRNMRLMAGKVMMDVNCPAALRDTPESAYADSRALIERWHGHGRLGYAITPRFALTSSPAQLEAAGRLAREYPNAWVHTHLAENREEVDAAAAQFPDRRSYLDVYDRHGLVRERSVFAHCLYVDDTDRAVMAKHGAAGAFCPTSNLFLGSGLFDLAAMATAGVDVGLGTDVGGGTSLSMFATMAEAYKVLHLNGQPLAANRALHLATLGAAEALGLDDRLGNFAPGKEADLIVVDPQASPAMRRRAGTAATIEELLFALIFLADDRHVTATYLQGERA